MRKGRSFFNNQFYHTRPISKIAFLCFIVALTNCKTKNKETPTVQIQGDTLKIVTWTNGDTIFKSHLRLDKKKEEDYIDTSIYTTKPVDTAIASSGMYFRCRSLKVYFDSAEVVSFCDSILQSYPPPKDRDEYYATWNDINSAKNLKKLAQLGNGNTFIMGGWCESLLSRFPPLIIDTSSQQVLGNILIERHRNRYATERNWLALNHQGDTVLLGCDQQEYFEITMKSLNETP